MCTHFRPPTTRSMTHWQYVLPGFEDGDAYPGSTAPFLPTASRREWIRGTFGLMPHWARPDLFRRTYNARSETADVLPSFRNAWKHRQWCVIPVDAFFEPNYESGRPVQWRIERADGAPFGLAGLWERRFDGDESRWSFTMLTINADEHPLMSAFHAPGKEKRSVVILADDEWDDWLDCAPNLARLFLKPFDPELMVASPDPLPPRSKKAA